MRLLFYSPVSLQSGGGCERWHCDVTASLKKRFKDDIQIVTGNLGRHQWNRDYLNSQLAVPYEELVFPILSGNLLPTPAIFFKLLKHFKQADAVHFIYGFFGQDILMLILKLITGKRIIVGHHAPIFHENWFHNFQLNFFSRFLLNFFDAHMTLNASDKDFLERKWGIKNVYFIPSGVRTERFLNLKRASHSKLNFLTVGSYRTSQKGIDLALDAIKLFNSKNPRNRATFNFVGGGVSSKQLNVRELGYVKYEDMPKIYEQNDVYLLSSREEPFGLVLIESWAAGMPVLATKTEGPKDMLIENQNGWFIQQTTVRGIFRSIERVYRMWQNSPNSFLSMARSCRKMGMKYSIDETAKSMRKLFTVL